MSNVEWAVGQRVAVFARGNTPYQRVVLKVTKLHVIVGRQGDDPKTADKYRLTGRSIKGDAWSFTTITPWTAEHTRKSREAKTKREAEDLADKLRDYVRSADAADLNAMVVDHLRQAAELLTVPS